MQLKISRASGNYLVLQLPGAVLTAFKDACGDNPQIDLQLPDGAEGDDQFRKFLAQVMEAEERGKPTPGININAQAELVAELQDEIQRLKLRLNETFNGKVEHTAVDELNPRLHEAKIGEGVDGMSMATGALTVGPGNIFEGKSIAWLQGFQACREYRQRVLVCEERDSQTVPVEPLNPYAKTASEQAQRVSWKRGWAECFNYLVNEMPDPTHHLEKAQ